MKTSCHLIFSLITLSILFYACTEDEPCEGTIGVNIVLEGTNVLRAEAHGGIAPYYYSWSNGVRGLSVITVTDPGNYRVIVNDFEGCTASTSFNFTSGTSNACGTDTIVTDIAGYVYRIVSIGNQCWMADNVKLSAGITEVANTSAWGSLTTPAWCYYDNQSSNSSDYGKLFNWYAIILGDLCPSGWHVPTDAEWQTLVDFLGGDSIAGGAMKTLTLWTSPNTGATNSSGFSGKPGGIRNLSGDFVSMGNSGVYWSSTPVNADQAWGRELVYNNASMSISNSDKARGFSCRCVKD